MAEREAEKSQGTYKIYSEETQSTLLKQFLFKILKFHY